LIEDQRNVIASGDALVERAFAVNRG